MTAKGKPWVMRQVWHDLLFAHWPVSPSSLREMVPRSLTLDTWNGQAWIGVVPFRMSGIRPRFLPPLPWLSAFPELNVRTYVLANGKPGVYFFSLDAANPVAVRFARRFFHLPYFDARMELLDRGAEIEYRSSRTHKGAPKAEFDALYRPVGSVYASQPGSLEHWLTERYCLYAVAAGERVFRADIQHVPWPLQPAEAEFSLNAVSPIELPGIPPLLHFSRRLEVVVWWPTPLENRSGSEQGDPGPRAGTESG